MTNETEDGAVLTAKGTAAFYVKVASPRLPVRYTERGTVEGQPGTFAMTFSRWGEEVPIRAPSGVIAFSSLPSVPNTPSPQSPDVLT